MASIATLTQVLLALACLVIVPSSAIADLHADGPREITEGPFQSLDTLRIGSDSIRVRTTGRITKLQGYHPTFSPDGQLVVYCAPKSEGEIYSNLMISRDGGDTGEPLVETDSIKYRPLFSPDGRYIAYAESENEPNREGDGVIMLWLYDLETGQRTQVTAENRRAVHYVGSSTNYDWSWAGNKIVYTAREFINRLFRYIYVYDVEKREHRLIYTASFTKFHGRPYFAAQWSPDGSRIGFIDEIGDAPRFGTLDSDGWSATILLKSEIWSHDLRWIDNNTIVTSAGGASQYRVEILDLTTQNSEHLTMSSFNFLSKISMDRTTVLYSDEWGIPIYYALDLRSRREDRLFSIDTYETLPDFSIDISGDGSQVVFSLHNTIVTVDVPMLDVPR